MITIRKTDKRGRTRLDWLDSRHSFSFGHYQDPRHNGFGNLLVVNDDRVAPGGGFGTHPHRDMEILSYVLEGEMKHRDSMGNGSVIRAGDLQKMSAGTGVTHSEFNPSASEPVHFYQIWIEPDRRGLPPSYEQVSLRSETKDRGLRLIAAPEAPKGGVTLHQDARIYLGRLDAGDTGRHEIADGRQAWIQVLRGELEVAGESLGEGDGAAIVGEPGLDLKGIEESEFFLFDLAA